MIIFVLLIDIDFICLLMLVDNDGIYSDLALVYNLVIFGIFLFSCTLYSWYYLPKNQEKIWAFNQWETYGGK